MERMECIICNEVDSNHGPRSDCDFWSWASRNHCSLYACKKILLDRLRRVLWFSRVCSRRVSGRAGSAAYARYLCFFCRGFFGAQYFMLLVAMSDRPWACSTWQRQTDVRWMGLGGGDPGIWRGRVGSRVSGLSGSGHVHNLMHVVEGPLFNLYWESCSTSLDFLRFPFSPLS